MTSLDLAWASIMEWVDVDPGRRWVGFRRIRDEEHGKVWCVALWPTWEAKVGAGGTHPNDPAEAARLAIEDWNAAVEKVKAEREARD